MTNRITGLQPNWTLVDGDEWELGLDPVVLVRVYELDGRIVDDTLPEWEEERWGGRYAVYR